MKIKFTLLSALIYLCTATGGYSQVQNALAFDGTDDYVSVPAGSSLISGSNQISLTCWVYPTNAFPAYPDFDGFAGIRNDIDADFYMVQTGANQLEARFRNSSGIAFDINFFGLALNTWQHYAFTYDGSYIRLFKDGSIVDSLAANGNITNSGVDFLIGDVRFSNADFYMNGTLDEISFWNASLSAPEIHCIYRSEIDTLSTGLQLYYKCNQGIAGGNNGTITTLHDQANHIDGNLNLFALTGTFSNFVTGATNFTLFADSICQGDQYTFGTQILTTSGNYYQYFSTAEGCDSIVQLSLTVQSVDTSVTQVGNSLVASILGATYQWIDCNNGNAIIPGAFINTYTPTVNGSYAVIVTKNGCSDTSSCHLFNSVGIMEAPSQEYILTYSSSTEDILFISAASAKKCISIGVYDVTGKKITGMQYASFLKEAIDLKSWKPGVYYLTIQSPQNIITKKIIKK